MLRNTNIEGKTEFIKPYVCYNNQKDPFNYKPKFGKLYKNSKVIFFLMSNSNTGLNIMPEGLSADRIDFELSKPIPSKNKNNSIITETILPFSLEDDVNIILIEKKLKENSNKHKSKEIINEIAKKLNRKSETIRTRRKKLKSIAISEWKMLLAYYYQYKEVGSIRKIVFNNGTFKPEIRTINDERLPEAEIRFIDKAYEDGKSLSDVVNPQLDSPEKIIEEEKSIRIEFRPTSDKSEKMSHKSENEYKASKQPSIKNSHISAPYLEDYILSQSPQEIENPIEVEELDVKNNTKEKRIKTSTSSGINKFKVPKNKNRRLKSKKARLRAHENSKLSHLYYKTPGDSINLSVHNMTKFSPANTKMNEYRDMLSNNSVKKHLKSHTDRSKVDNDIQVIENIEDVSVYTELLDKRPKLSTVPKQKNEAAKPTANVKKDRFLEQKISIEILKDKLTHISDIIRKENEFRIKRFRLETDLMNFANTVNGFKEFYKKHKGNEKKETVDIVQDFITNYYEEIKSDD